MKNQNDKYLFEAKCKEMLTLWEQAPCRLNKQKIKAMQDLISKPRISNEMIPGTVGEVVFYV